MRHVLRLLHQNCHSQWPHQYGFAFGWEIGEFPDEGTSADLYLNGGFAAVVRPAFPQNIHHFAEAVLFLFHASLHSGTYPWFCNVTTLLLPTVSKQAELQWSREFLELVTAARDQG